jgi:hypothetical protein
MSQYGAPEQSRSPAPGGMGYGQASQQSQYGAPPQGQYGREQFGRPEQQSETFALQSQEGQQNQQGQANQTGQEQQGQQGQQGQQQGNTQGQGEDEKQRPGEGALQAAGKPGPAASHPHSRFHQDPHHHAAMSAFHKIASAISCSSLLFNN